MPHIYGLSNIDLTHPSLLTIGVFDGVHKGHQHLIRQLVQSAHAAGRLAVVLTFFPHPDQVVHEIQGRYYLTTAEERAEYLMDLGVDYVVTYPFDATVQQSRAEAFVGQLVEKLHPVELWVGANFVLGYKREGDVCFLTEQGKARGFTVYAIDLLLAEGAIDGETAITSTLIRDSLRRGEVEQVHEWLGRAYTVSGEVVHGSQRGQTIGFPTANVAVWDQKVLPANGVYATWVEGDFGRCMAVTNIGVRPTFESHGVTVEAHLLDFVGDLYGKQLTLSFERYLRPELKFTTLQALIDQIGTDVEIGRTYLSACCVEI